MFDLKSKTGNFYDLNKYNINNNTYQHLAIYPKAFFKLKIISGKSNVFITE